MKITFFTNIRYIFVLPLIPKVEVTGQVSCLRPYHHLFTISLQYKMIFIYHMYSLAETKNWVFLFYINERAESEASLFAMGLK